MNALINRLQEYENPNTSFCIEESYFIDYSKINFVKNESLIGKSCRFDHSKQALLIATILLSQPNKFLAAPMIVSEHFQIDFRQAQIPLPAALLRFDSSLFYVTNKRETKSVNKADLEEEFHDRALQWEDETSFHSSLGEIFTNECYQRIIGMGRDALPWIFSELERKPRPWFYALEKIVGFDVAADAKNFAEARAMWLEWAKNNFYI